MLFAAWVPGSLYYYRLKNSNTFVKIFEVIWISYAKYEVSVTTLLLQPRFQENNRANHSLFFSEIISLFC